MVDLEISHMFPPRLNVPKLSVPICVHTTQPGTHARHDPNIQSWRMFPDKCNLWHKGADFGVENLKAYDGNQ